MKLIRMERIEAASGKPSGRYADICRLFSVVTGLNPHHNRVNPVAGGGRNKQAIGLSLAANQGGCGLSYGHGGSDRGRRLDARGMIWTLSAIARRECGSSLFNRRITAALRLVCRGVFFARLFHGLTVPLWAGPCLRLRACRFLLSGLPTRTVPPAILWKVWGGSLNLSIGA